MVVDWKRNRVRWSVATTQQYDAALAGNRLIMAGVYCTSESPARVFDLDSGRLQAATGGCLSGAGAHWFATSNGAVRVYWLR